MELEEAIRQRRSTRHLDPAATIDDAELTRLFELVRLTPSSYNLQHWRFVVVRERENKAALREAAYGQAQVEDAAAVVVVCGKLDAYGDAERAWADAAAPVRDALVPQIEPFYAPRPEMQRDEAIRSGSMAAMTLMLAAQAAGWATGPMIGFDAARVAELVGLDETFVPVMLVVLGRPAGEAHPRPTRWPVSEIVRQERWDGQGLGG